MRREVWIERGRRECGKGGSVGRERKGVGEGKVRRGWG